MYDQQMCGALIDGIIGNIFLLSPQLLFGLVSITYAPLSLESKSSKRFGIITFSAIHLCIWPKGITAVHWFLVLY